MLMLIDIYPYLLYLAMVYCILLHYPSNQPFGVLLRHPKQEWTHIVNGFVKWSLNDHRGFSMFHFIVLNPPVYRVYPMNLAELFNTKKKTPK